MAWLSSNEALALLKVRPQTLYANVSRGRIRVRPDPTDSRRSLYHDADVRRLADRHAGPRSAAAVAAETISFGDPVLVSGLSSIAQGRLWYRGQDAVCLADRAGLEEVAALLWQVDGLPPFEEVASGDPPAGAGPFQAALAALALRAGRDAPSKGRSRAILCTEAASLVGLIAGSMLADGTPPARPMHLRVAAAWGAPDAAEAIRCAMVLLADHELNASAFAARVTVSTGASLAAGLLSALATLAGPLHGGAFLGMQALARAALDSDGPSAVHDWLARGHALPAFGHPLYPNGDPRAIALLSRFEPSPAYAEIHAAVETLTGEPPNIDFALAALCDALGLPGSAPFTLFAIARSIGWIAHGLEQATRGSLIRPRAQYDGPPLEMG